MLRVSGANELWTVDLELGPRHLRTELLKSVTFRLDGNGRPLPAPVALLFASTGVERPTVIEIASRGIRREPNWYRPRLANALLSQDDGPLFERGVKGIVGRSMRLPARDKDHQIVNVWRIGSNSFARPLGNHGRGGEVRCLCGR